jgi:phospholipid/cholesterol/gamma-HCH transport system substrate-binding protein
MSNQLVETLMGAVVLIVAALFLVFAYSSTNVRPLNGYEVTAKFDRVDGLNPGSDVKISGIKVGTVINEKLDPETFLAIVTISLQSGIKLPTDTVAQVSSEGLLGGNFLALVPGSDDKDITPGGEIKYTQAPVNLMQLLGKFIFNTGQAAAQGSQGQGAPAQGQPPGGAPAGGSAAPAPTGAK